MRAHIIENGYVINTIEVDSLDIFPDLIDAEQGGSIGDLYIDGEFQKPVAPTPDWPAVIAERRYIAEIAGTTWGGYGIATDRGSQTKITQEDVAVQRGLRVEGAGWKCLDLTSDMTVFRPTSNAEIQQLSGTVYLYVSACFAREDELLAAVTDGLITAEMLEEGWPA